MLIMDALPYVWAVVGLAWLCLYWKGAPFVFSLRSLGIVLRGGPRLEKATDAVEHRETVILSDMDYNLHANNTFYPLLGDYVRIQLFMRLYGSLATFRALPVHNAGVATLFLREFRFLDPVVLRARIVSLEESKWLYVLLEYTHGRTKKLHALALTRMVFKTADRKTVPPREALRRLGYDLSPSVLADDAYGPLVAKLQATMECDVGGHAQAAPSRAAGDAAAPQLQPVAPPAVGTTASGKGGRGSKKGQ